MFNDLRLIDLASQALIGSRADAAPCCGDRQSVDCPGCVMSLLATPDGAHLSIATVATVLGLIESAGLHHTIRNTRNKESE